MLKRIIKGLFHAAGLKVEWRDRLLESIVYQDSPFLPRIHHAQVKRLFYQREMVEQVRDVPGNLVECGTSVGYGLLGFILISELQGSPRHYYSFDSFEGFPSPAAEDNGTHVTKGFLASPPEVLLRVLRDGGVREEVLESRLHVGKGFFDKTLPGYSGPIALLHLDCDLYDSYRVALEMLYDQVSPGGVIMFDEYRDPHFPGADKAIDEFFAQKPEKLVQHRYGNYYVVKQ
jgi:O-methyltransferase